MATSGSVNFTLNRNEIIRAALKKIGSFSAEENLDAYTVQTCKEALNLLLKRLQTRGLGLWLIQEAALFFEPGKFVYLLGPTGDRVSNNYHVTATSAAASETDTTITVSDATDLAADDVIGVVLDDGTIQWSTIDSIAGSVVTLDDALTDDVASGAKVYVYTTKINRPLELLEARSVESSSYERPLNIYGRNEYLRLTDKSSTGKVVNVYFDPQLTNCKLYVWPVPDSRSDYIKFSYKTPIEDMDVSIDNLHVPPEWEEIIVYNLAVSIMPEFGTQLTPTRERLVVQKAEQLLLEGERFDTEHVSIRITPRRIYR